MISYRDGRLFVEDIAVENIAGKTATPFYCYSAARIAENFRAWHDAAGDFATICYACKANDNLAVLKLLARMGAGADIVSGGELRRALLAGIPADKIVFSGVGKTREEILQAIRAGILQINVESESELLLISTLAQEEQLKARVALRVNPDIDGGTHAKITTGKKGGKFGLDISEAPALYRRGAGLPGIEMSGIAMHIGSQMLDLAPFRAAFESAARLIESLRKDGLNVETVDLGGGLGIRYESETPPARADYAALARNIFAPLKLRVIMEPGRSIIGDAGILVTRVLHAKKSGGRDILIVDAGMNDLIRPAIYGARHPIVPCEEKAEKKNFDVVGPVCETSDIFLTDAQLPKDAKPGDLLAITVAGAYGSSMSSNYNARPLIAEILVRGAGFDTVRRVQTFDDMIQNETMPGWLS